MTTGPRDVSLAFAAAVSGGDVDAATALWHADAVMVGTDGATVRGRDALRERFAQLVAAGAQIDIAVDEVVEQGDVALGRTTMTMAFGGASVTFAGSVVYVRAEDGWRIAIDRVVAQA